MIEIIPNWHPIFVHFTVALISTAVGFFLLAKLLENRPIQEQCLIVARWNLWIGTGFALITVVAGFLAYNSVNHDTPSHAAMIVHRNWALGTIAVLLPFTFWAWWEHRTNKPKKVSFLVVALLLLGLLFLTAWRGGELVYRYGLGVMSIPAAEEDGHVHGAEGHAHSSEITSPDSSHEHANEHKHADDKHSH